MQLRMGRGAIFAVLLAFGGKLPSVGNTVDVANAWTNSIGAPNSLRSGRTRRSTPRSARSTTCA